MRRLINRRGRERGAVAVIVALVAGMFVLTGVAALTIDAGSLYAERRVVQNAADAASLSLAQSCARGDAQCSASATDLASLANLNSPDGFTDIESVCFSTDPCGAAIILAATQIPPASPGLVECTKLPTSLQSGVKWVEVRTKTHSTTSDPTVVGKFFARLSDPTYHGVGVKACARAAWGPLGAFSVIAPMAISLCDYQAMITTSGYAVPPAYASPIPTSVTSHEVAVVVNDPGQTTDSNNCARWAGHVLPGGFGYLNDGINCNQTVTAGAWVHGKPGASVPALCTPFMDTAMGTRILIPVFDCVSDSTLICPPANRIVGEDVDYRIRGMAAFYVSGYKLPSYNSPSLNAATTCPSGKCLYGWFTQATLQDGGDSFGSGDGYGVNKIKVGG